MISFCDKLQYKISNAVKFKRMTLIDEEMKGKIKCYKFNDKNSNNLSKL